MACCVTARFADAGFRRRHFALALGARTACSARSRAFARSHVGRPRWLPAGTRVKGICRSGQHSAVSGPSRFTPALEEQNAELNRAVQPDRLRRGSPWTPVAGTHLSSKRKIPDLRGKVQQSHTPAVGSAPPGDLAARGGPATLCASAQSREEVLVNFCLAYTALQLMASARRFLGPRINPVRLSTTNSNI